MHAGKPARRMHFFSEIETRVLTLVPIIDSRIKTRKRSDQARLQILKGLKVAQPHAARVIHTETMHDSVWRTFRRMHECTSETPIDWALYSDISAVIKLSMLLLSGSLLLHYSHLWHSLSFRQYLPMTPSLFESLSIRRPHRHPLPPTPALLRRKHPFWHSEQTSCFIMRQPHENGLRKHRFKLYLKPLKTYKSRVSESRIPNYSQSHMFNPHVLIFESACTCMQMHAGGDGKKRGPPFPSP